MDNREDQKKFPQPSWFILVVAAAAWFGLIVYFANGPRCLALSRCDTDDFILFGIIAVGLLVPAGIAAFVIEKLLSGFFDVNALHSFNVSEKEREDDMAINRYGKD
jgi:hypothetical protein